RVEHVLEQARIAVVVLGHDEQERVRARDHRRELQVLDGLARVGHRYRERPNVDELGLDALARRELAEDEVCHVLARTALARRPEYDWNEERAVHDDSPSRQSSAVLCYAP